MTINAVLRKDSAKDFHGKKSCDSGATTVENPTNPESLSTGTLSEYDKITSITHHYEALKNCGDLLAFSDAAARYQNRRSKMQLSGSTVYALVVDALCEDLLPKNHIPSHLMAKSIKLMVNCSHEIERFGRGIRSEGRLHEILEICDNHHAQSPTSLLLYVRSMSRLLENHLVFEISSSLIRKYRPDKPETASELKNNSSLRLLYAAMISAIRRKMERPDEDDCNASVASFVLRNGALHAALLQRNYDAFLKEIHIATIKDAMETCNILASAIRWELPTIRIVYNTLLTCIMSLSSGDLERHPEQKQYLFNTTVACINSLLPYSNSLCEILAKFPHRNATEPKIIATIQDVIPFLAAIEGDVKNFSSLIEIPKIPYSSPVIYNNDYGLEKIAATLLVLYPGTKVTGDEILLHDGKPYLINLGTQTINAEHPCFTRTREGKYSPQEEIVVTDIRKLFAHMQELVPHMDWDIFIKELRTICTNMKNESFAKNAQQHITDKLRSNLPKSTLFDKKLAVVAYESLLPRVNDILTFLDNKHLLEITKHYTKLVYSLRTEAEVFSTDDFIEISGYKRQTEGDVRTKRRAESQSLFTAINNGYKHFEMSISVPELQSSYTPIPKAPSEEGSPEYTISDLCSKKRKKLVKTLARRSPHYVLLRELYYIVLPLITLCTAGITYFFITPLMPVKTIMVAIVFSVALFIAAFVHKKVSHKKCYLMSIGNEIKDTKSLYKYFPDAEEHSSTSSNDNRGTGFIERKASPKNECKATRGSIIAEEDNKKATMVCEKSVGTDEVIRTTALPITHEKSVHTSVSKNDKDPSTIKRDTVQHCGKNSATEEQDTSRNNTLLTDVSGELCLSHKLKFKCGE